MRFEIQQRLLRLSNTFEKLANTSPKARKTVLASSINMLNATEVTKVADGALDKLKEDAEKKQSDLSFKQACAVIDSFIKNYNWTPLLNYAKISKRNHPKLSDYIEKSVISSNIADLAYKLAEIPGYDVKALQNVVIASGDTPLMYSFAKNIPNADISSLENAILKSTDPIAKGVAKAFARDVKKPTIASRLERLAKIMLKLAADVKVTDINPETIENFKSSLRRMKGWKLDKKCDYLVGQKVSYNGDPYLIYEADIVGSEILWSLISVDFNKLVEYVPKDKISIAKKAEKVASDDSLDFSSFIPELESALNSINKIHMLARKVRAKDVGAGAEYARKYIVSLLETLESFEKGSKVKKASRKPSKDNVGETQKKLAGDNKKATWSKKFHQLTYWTSHNTETTVECASLKKAMILVKKSGFPQDLKVASLTKTMDSEIANLKKADVISTKCNVPNLDGMAPSELAAFAYKWKNASDIEAEALVGKRSNAAKIAYLLSAYAINKATAMRLREKGNIEEAMKYETKCDRFYFMLPGDCRW